MSDEALQGVIETIDTASEYRLQLAELLENLNDAQVQVKESASASVEQLNMHFGEMRKNILEAVDTRWKELLKQVSEIEASSLEPLVNCELLIQKQINMAADVLAEGKRVLGTEHEAGADVMTEFKNRANNLGLNSLPEVPLLSEVACISVDLPPDQGTSFVAEVGEYGQVVARAPVQITDVQARPGSLLVKWNVVEEEGVVLDLSEFRLQFCTGHIKPSEAHKEMFHEAYTGPNCSYILHHIQPSVFYTFRVCGRADGAEVWSPWSIPHSGMTLLEHYEWSQQTEGYSTSNENKVALREEDGHCGLLYSNACYSCGHSVVVKVIEDGEVGQLDGIGLTANNKNTKTLVRKGALFVSVKGKVYVDGQEKMTKLPPLSKGSIITFDTEVLSQSKVRVTVEVNEKVVTFDWTIDCSEDKETGDIAEESMLSPTLGMSQNQHQSSYLYFAILFTHKDWTVSVE